MKNRLLLSALFLVLGLRAGAQCNAITSAPITISTPGTWCLTKDVLQTSGSGSAIVITSSAVTLDLHGYRLISTGPSAIFVVGGLSNVIIRNGQVTSAGSGIVIVADEKISTTDVLLERLALDSILNHGIHAVANHMVIRDVTVTGASHTSTPGEGIWVAGDYVDVDHVVVNDAFPIGFDASLGATRLTLRNSVINGSDRALVLVGGANVTNNQLNGDEMAVDLYGGTFHFVGNRISAKKIAINYNLGAFGKYRETLFVDGTTVAGGTDAGNNN